MPRLSIRDLQRIYADETPLVVCTAYDATMAALVDPHVDAILVGDSLGMVVQGLDNTLQVTLEHMAYHSRAVQRGSENAHLVVDMPFMSYQVNADDAIRAAGRLLQDGGAQSVKLEGGVSIAPTVERLVEIGIPVMGHIGLTPQSVHTLGGYKVQGREAAAADQIKRDAFALESAGAYAIVLELVPMELAAEITSALKVPTIGIGAGPHCSGQVLVSNDLLGLNPDFAPRFVKRYAELGQTAREAVSRYAEEVRHRAFPAKEHCFRGTSLEVVTDQESRPYQPTKSG